ncbi:MAG TPA: energy transducer TonB [Rhizomicrobium sp.]|jgi:protein TonB
MNLRLAISALAIAALGTTAALAEPAHVDASADNQTIYPIRAQSSGEEGVVKLQAYVRSNGRATRVRMVQSSGFSDLDDAAIQTVMNWRFVPSSAGGTSQSDWADLQIVYKLPSDKK